MTPEKKKAKELYLRFLLKLPFDKEVITENKHGKWSYCSEQLAQEHALICVDETIKALPKLVAADGMGSARFNNPQIEFWQSVKTELEKM